MAIMHFDTKTARVSVASGRCLRVRFRDMSEVCTLVLFIIIEVIIILYMYMYLRIYGNLAVRRYILIGT